MPDLSTNIIIAGPGPSSLTVARSGAQGTPEFGIFTVPVGVEVTISGLTITGGSEVSGGGIDNGGMLTVTNSILSGNSASGNSARIGSGGGIFNSGTLTLTDCTLSGNSARIGSGGGIDNGGTLTLTDCTLSSNSAVDGGGVYITQEVAGGPVAKVTATMSLFANPAGGNLVLGAGAAFVSLGHNLFSDTPGVTLDPTDLINTDPLLGPLADNGGPTLTQALLPGSPAIDAGVAVPGVTTDQRGVPRPQGIAPDIGAFESRGFTLAVVQGDNQRAPAGSSFPVPLAVTIASPFGEPVGAAGSRSPPRRPAPPPPCAATRRPSVPTARPRSPSRPTASVASTPSLPGRPAPPAVSCLPWIT